MPGEIQNDPGKISERAVRPGDAGRSKTDILRPRSSPKAHNQNRLRLPDVPRSPRTQAGRVPVLRNGARTRGPGRLVDAHRIHLPHASGDRAARPGLMPDVRHGPRAPHRHRRARRKSRTARHDPAILDQPGPHRTAAGHRHGRDALGNAAARPSTQRSVPLGWSSPWPRRSCSGAARPSFSASGPHS